jgi:hypothetical protein
MINCLKTILKACSLNMSNEDSIEKENIAHLEKVEGEGAGLFQKERHQQLGTERRLQVWV